MKYLLLVVFFIVSFSVSAQDDSYVEFNTAQKEKSKAIAELKTAIKVTFNSGMDYEGTLFWHVVGSDGKEFYFNSTSNFTEVKYEEAAYSSLMEYVIENIGF